MYIYKKNSTEIYQKGSTNSVYIAISQGKVIFFYTQSALQIVQAKPQEINYTD